MSRSTSSGMSQTTVVAPSEAHTYSSGFLSSVPSRKVKLHDKGKVENQDKLSDEMLYSLEIFFFTNFLI